MGVVKSTSFSAECAGEAMTQYELSIGEQTVSVEMGNGTSTLRLPEGVYSYTTVHSGTVCNYTIMVTGHHKGKVEDYNLIVSVFVCFMPFNIFVVLFSSHVYFSSILIHPILLILIFFIIILFHFLFTHMIIFPTFSIFLFQLVSLYILFNMDIQLGYPPSYAIGLFWNGRS